MSPRERVKGAKTLACLVCVCVCMCVPLGLHAVTIARTGTQEAKTQACLVEVCMCLRASDREHDLLLLTCGSLPAPGLFTMNIFAEPVGSLVT